MLSRWYTPRFEGPTSGRRPELDGVRGIAIALVVASHALLPTGVFEGGGFVGVQLFFVLSGYLITGILMREREQTGSISLRHFYERRLRRLAPALVLFLAVYAAWAIVEGLDRSHDVLAAILYSANWVEATGNSMHEIGHLWSVAVEEQFYLVWPIALMALLRLPNPRAAILYLAVGLAVWRVLVFGVTTDWHRVYFATDTVAFALLAGAALAFLPRVRWPVAALGLGLLVALSITTNHQTGPAATASLMLTSPAAVLGSMALIAGAGGLLAWRPLVWLGEISYALYLWHSAINQTAGAIYGMDTAERWWVIPVSLVVAWASTRFVEARFRERQHQGRRLGADPVFAGSVLS